MAWANLALAPFLIVFLAIRLFLRNAEQLYHHPSSVGARRWSPLARWRLREFNELPHYIEHRCAPPPPGLPGPPLPSCPPCLPSIFVAKANRVGTLFLLLAHCHGWVASMPGSF